MRENRVIKSFILLGVGVLLVAALSACESGSSTATVAPTASVLSVGTTGTATAAAVEVLTPQATTTNALPGAVATSAAPGAVNTAAPNALPTGAAQLTVTP